LNEIKLTFYRRYQYETTRITSNSNFSPFVSLRPIVPSYFRSQCGCRGSGNSHLAQRDCHCSFSRSGSVALAGKKEIAKKCKIIGNWAWLCKKLKMQGM
jgi:hypothetical protein